MTLLAEISPTKLGRDSTRPETSGVLAEFSRLDLGALFARLDSSPQGLSEAEAEARIGKYGLNRVTRERKPGISFHERFLNHVMSV